jgi:hypothetical protein
MWQRCNSLVRVNNLTAAAEIDRLSADSKFFRSMSLAAPIAFLAAVPAHLLSTEQVKGGISALAAVALAATVITAFSLNRYLVLRWKATKLIYEYYIILRPVVQEIPDKDGSLSLVNRLLWDRRSPGLFADILIALMTALITRRKRTGK